MVGDLKLNQKTIDGNLEAACSDASQLRSDKADLIDMNENMSNQISEQVMFNFDSEFYLSSTNS